MKYAVLFIALLFAGCGDGSSTVGYEIEIDGGTLQVAKEDFPLEMNWDNAMKACEELGNGWRLPTKEELVAMHEQLHKQGKGNFQHAYYWSSSKYGLFNAWCVNFGDCTWGASGRNISYRVRAVRAF